MENIYIRLEAPQDYRAVEELTRAAFMTHTRPGREIPLEHYMVNELRKKDGIMELDFVAEKDGQIVGHIIYSNAHILQEDGSMIHVLNFGPLSVLPDFQRQGIGSSLMKYSIEKAKASGYGAILFFGEPDYYPRFGFIEAKKFGITDWNGDNYPAFLAMELKEGYLKNVHGKYIEAEIYNDAVNMEQGRLFDIEFTQKSMS